jgi:hypothetical protein
LQEAIKIDNLRFSILGVLKCLKTATCAVLPEGVGKNQSNAQGGKSKNPFFQKFFYLFNCNDLAKTTPRSAAKTLETQRRFRNSLPSNVVVGGLYPEPNSQNPPSQIPRSKKLDRLIMTLVYMHICIY